MNANRISATPRTAVIALTLALAVSGCKKNPAAPDDATLTSQVQSALSSDQNLSGQTIQASVSGGVVTLNGNVTSETARTIASGDVAEVAGVRTVVNNLAVQAGPVSATAVAPPPVPVPVQPASAPVMKMKKPAAIVSHPALAPAPAPIVRNTPPPPPPAQLEPVQASAPSAVQAPPALPPPPPAPVVHSITLAAGFTIPVRITQTLDSATTETGDKFTGAIASDLVVDGMVVLPQGTPVTGIVDEAKDAAHFKGSSLLTVSLTSINRRGEHISVATDPYTKEGEGRGKNTAEKVGGGAAVGAILGGIFGGGKGAAIGAAAGGGVGAGAQGITRGQQVQIPSETVVRFKLSDAIIVRVPGNPAGNSNQLEHHTDQ